MVNKHNRVWSGIGCRQAGRQAGRQQESGFKEGKIIDGMAEIKAASVSAQVCIAALGVQGDDEVEWGGVGLN